MTSVPLPPGPKTLGFLLEIPRFSGGVLSYFTALSRRYPDPILHMKFGPGAVYLPNHPDVVREMLVQIPERFSRSRWLGELRALVGSGLLFSTEAEWVPQRRRLNPAYHGRHHEVVAEATRDEVEACSERWRRTPGGVVDVQEDVKRVLLRALVRIMFTPDIAVDARQIIADLDTVVQFVSMRNQFVRHHLGRLAPRGAEAEVRAAQARLDAFIFEIINGCRSGELRAGLMMAELLPAEARGEVDAANLHDEIGTLLLAGFDTTAGLITFALGELSERPDLCAALRAEAGQAEQPITRQVVRETLRLYPSVWGIYRTAAEPIELGGYQVPQGELVMLCPYAIQRNPAFWPDPDRFLPERFAGMPENDARLGMSYLPFSHGRHTCIGKRMALQQAHLMLGAVVTAFDLERPGRRPRLQAGVILKAAGGLPLRVRPRAQPAPAMAPAMSACPMSSGRMAASATGPSV